MPVLTPDATSIVSVELETDGWAGPSAGNWLGELGETATPGMAVKVQTAVASSSLQLALLVDTDWNRGSEPGSACTTRSIVLDSINAQK